jgi:hypothetical protein
MMAYLMVPGCPAMTVEPPQMALPALFPEAIICHCLLVAATTVAILKLKKRPTNFIENKGLLWKTCELSGNVIENKRTYTSIPGMLSKTHDLSA